MTPLEHETYADGFLVCVFGAVVDRARDVVAWRAELHDGGRRAESADGVGAASAPRSYGAARRMLLRTVPTPGIVAGYGRGWRELVAEILPSLAAAELRILDLRRTAAALAPGASRSAALPTLARHFGVEWEEPESGGPSRSAADLLWAVVAEAGARGMSWTDLLEIADLPAAPVPFEQYRFAPAELDALPAAPAVYVLRDSDGVAFYVGKTADLARRMQEYFHPTREASARVVRIRDRVHDLDYRLVGSELEALLLENRLIRELAPDANVQRRVAEGSSRYRFRRMAVAVLLRSFVDERVDVFFFAGGTDAIQVHADPRRPPRATLRSAVAAFASGRGRVRRTRATTTWGPDGAEICGRFFARFRDRLHWMEINAAQPIDRTVDDLLAVIDRVATTPGDPTEFRVPSPLHDPPTNTFAD